MHILFTRFPLQSAQGGAEKQTVSLWQGLAKRGHQIQFVGSCPILLKQSEKLEMKSEKLEIGIPPVTKWSAVSFLWRQHAMKKKLTSCVLHLPTRPDVIFMLSLSEKLLLTKWAEQHGSRVIWVEHDSVGNWLRWNPWLPVLRKLSALATTVTVSDMSRQMYHALGWQGTVIAIPNGVERITSPVHTQSSDGTLRLGCISRLTPDKGVDLLVEAVADLPSVSLTIVGRGKGETNIRTQIAEQCTKRHSAPQRIRLLTEYIDLAAFYGSIDALVLPSRAPDPFGMVAAEAMLAGLPVVVTDACGIAGYLNQNTDALIVPANSAPALQAAIHHLSNATTRAALAAAGKRTAGHLFSLERMIDAYDHLLQGAFVPKVQE